MTRNVWMPSIILLVAAIAAASANGWSRDAWLLVRLKLASDDAFAMGHNGFPLLMGGDQKALNEFPPARLAEFAGFPDCRIRAVALLSLERREDDLDPVRWIGVAPRLLRAYLEDSDVTVRECARSALLRLPALPGEDADAVSELIDLLPDGAPSAALRSALLDRLGR